VLLHEVDAEDSGDFYAGFGGDGVEGPSTYDEEGCLAGVAADFVGQVPPWPIR